MRPRRSRCPQGGRRGPSAFARRGATSSIHGNGFGKRPWDGRGSDSRIQGDRSCPRKPSQPPFACRLPARRALGSLHRKPAFHPKVAAFDPKGGVAVRSSHTLGRHEILSHDCPIRRVSGLRCPMPRRVFSTTGSSPRLCRCPRRWHVHHEPRGHGGGRSRARSLARLRRLPILQVGPSLHRRQ